MLAALGARHPHDGRLDWLVPALLLAGEGVFLAALGLARHVTPWVVFALLAAVAHASRRPGLPGPGGPRHPGRRARPRLGRPDAAGRRWPPWPGSRRSPTPPCPDIFGCFSSGISSPDGSHLRAGPADPVSRTETTHDRPRPRCRRRPPAASVHRHAAQGLVPVDGPARRAPSSTSRWATSPRSGSPRSSIVVGYRGGGAGPGQAALEREYGVALTLVDNDKAEEWNNAYSLWCARDLFAEGVLLANGDTVHPVSVERTLLAAAGRRRASCSPSTR